MAKYHINPDTGETGVCRAKKKCRFGNDQPHFQNKEEAAKFVEEKYRMAEVIDLIRSRPPNQLETTTQALESSLSYDGEEPEWFQNFVETAKNSFTDGGSKAKPELIDVINFDGEPVAVIWEQESSETSDVWVQEDRGYVCNRLLMKNFDNGETVGYARIGYVTEDSLAKSFGNDGLSGLRWTEDAEGKRMGLEKYDEVVKSSNNEDDVIAAKRKLWVDAHQALNVPPKSVSKSLWNLSIEDAPESMELLESEISELNNAAVVKMESHLTNHTKPTPDFTKVQEDYRGMGVAQSMYVYTARMLGKQGRSLNSAALQSEDAERMWRRLISDERLDISVAELNRSFGARVAYKMDFTK